MLLLLLQFFFTCSHVDIPGLDPPELVLCPTPVGPGVNLLLVVAGLEGREDEVAVVHHLEIQQSTRASSQQGHPAPLFVSNVPGVEECG